MALTCSRRAFECIDGLEEYMVEKRVELLRVNSVIKEGADAGHLLVGRLNIQVDLGNHVMRGTLTINMPPNNKGVWVKSGHLLSCSCKPI